MIAKANLVLIKTAKTSGYIFSKRTQKVIFRSSFETNQPDKRTRRHHSDGVVIVGGSEVHVQPSRGINRIFQSSDAKRIERGRIFIYQFKELLSTLSV
jgi:hypothetical protein